MSRGLLFFPDTVYITITKEIMLPSVSNFSPHRMQLDRNSATKLIYYEL